VTQTKIAKNTKTLIFGLHGRSRSSRLIPLKTSSAVLVTISSKFMSIFNRVYDKRVNSGK